MLFDVHKTQIHRGNYCKHASINVGKWNWLTMNRVGFILVFEMARYEIFKQQQEFSTGYNGTIGK